MKRGFWTVAKHMVRKSDVVLEVLDARMPEITRNSRLEKQARKKLILVFNKIDIVSENTIKNLKKTYSGKDYALVSSKKNSGISRLIRMIKKHGSKVAVIGYPNTGKSSLINKLSKGGKARTSSESGFTRGKQLIAGRENIMLMDSPGVVPYENRKELLLGLTSSISPSKLKDPELVAYELFKIFRKNNPFVIKKKYKLDVDKTPEDMLIQFAHNKKMLMKGGVPDERRAAIRFLMDWHQGKVRV